ncbi:MAG: lipopolysaccharide biosynthesis protein [Phycisphaerales bacterium]|nr:lipopolysaccharide biosynthesis protein [Phycisphaerales bacterium]
MHTPRSLDTTLVISAASIAYALTLALNVVIARTLPAMAYGEFSSAVALVGITCTCATLGLEKYALRLLPEYIQSSRLGEVKGYVVFGALVSLVVGVGISFCGLHLYREMKPHTGDTAVLEQMLWFVPAIALFLFVLEVATSFRPAIGSTLIYRIVLPCTTLLAMIVAPRLISGFDVGIAVSIYGGSWSLALLIMAIYAAAVAPRGLASTHITLKPRKWLFEGLGFLGMSLVMTVFGQCSILVLEVLRDDSVGVALLSAAMQIAGLAIIVQTATIRIFGPELARMIAQGDSAGQRRLVRKRSLLMAALGAAFFAIILLFGKRFLEMFGSEYVAAYPTLVVLTIGNVINITLGFAPTYLQFHDRHRLVLIIGVCGTVVAVSATAAGALYGDYATVAKAYVVALIAMYAAFQISMRIHSARNSPRPGISAAST